MKKLSLFRSLKMFYRQESATAFILLMAITNIFIGSFNQSWTLFSFSLLMMIIALFPKWRKKQKFKPLRRKKQRVSSYISRQPVYISPRTPLTPLPPLKRKRDYL